MKTSETTSVSEYLANIEDYCKRLRLPGLKQRLIELIDDPKVEKSDPLWFLEEVLGYESRRRQSNALNRRIKEAQICIPDANIGTIDYTVDRGISKGQINALMQMRWLSEKQNVIITGAVGCGKTFLACALANQACLLGKSTRMVRMPLLLAQMAASHQIADVYFKRLKELKNIDLLVLDDWGIGQLNARAREDLLSIITERHMQASTIVTSILPVNKWAEYLEDLTIADVILDRLVPMAHCISLRGESMRKLKAVQAQQVTAAECHDRPKVERN